MRLFSVWGARASLLFSIRAIALCCAIAVVPSGTVQAASVSGQHQASDTQKTASAPEGRERTSPSASPQRTSAQKKKTAAGKSTKADAKNPQAKKSGPVAKPSSTSNAATSSKSAASKASPAKPAATPDPKTASKPVGDDAIKVFPVAKISPASSKATKLPVATTWQPLMGRLAKDGVDGAYLRSLFGRLGDSYSHVPMGTKINELFTYKYMPPPPRKASGKPAPPKKSDSPPVYKSMLKPETVAKCKLYLAEHKAAFAAMEKEYGVPKEVVAGLLMVETRLGTYLGASSSFWSLACLAAADTPQRVEPTLQALPLPMTPDKMEWVTKLLRERSAWAYKELVALIKHSQASDLDPLVMPGSVYGAIGICQFMPSNLSKFAVDGNKDGKIDLFDPADAIPSVGNYLKKHGWEGSERDIHHKVIKRYNKSNVYANTILALAEAIVAPPVDPATAVADGAKKDGSAKKAAAKPNAKGKSVSQAKKGGKKMTSQPAKGGAKPVKNHNPSSKVAAPAKSAGTNTVQETKQPEKVSLAR